LNCTSAGLVGPAEATFRFGS